MANQPPQIAVLGAGIFVRNTYIPRLAEISNLLVLRAIWSRSEESARGAVEIAKKFFPDVECKWGEEGLNEIIQDSSIIGVAVVLAGQAQGRYVTEVAEGRKTCSSSFFAISGCEEKPAAASGTELEKAISCYNSINPAPIWAVAENYRFEPAFVEGRKLMAEIGDIINIHVIIEGSMNSSNPYYATSWRHDLIGGFILDMGVHYISGLRMLVGCEITSVSAVTSHVDSTLPPPDHISSTIQLENGSSGVFVMVVSSRSPKILWRVVGLKGTLQVERGSKDGKHGYMVILFTADGQSKSWFYPFIGVTEELKTFLSNISMATLKNLMLLQTFEARGLAKEVLGESKGNGPSSKDTSWWNEEVKQAIKTKRECYKVLGKCSSDENYERYKKARTEAKKAVRNARSKVNKELYARLDTKEGENDIYKLARMRERKTRDIGKVKCVKDTDQKVLVQDKEIKERWRSYFDTLFNGHQEQDIGNLNIPSSMVNREFKRRIQKGEVTMALKKMGSKKAEGPDGIPIEVWRCLGERGIDWLTMLFNKIWRSNKMPSAWRKSILVPLYKNKGDVQDCSNYRGIKLMSHTMKLWERVIEQRIRKCVKITENQFGFMPGRSTMEAIYLIRQLMEHYRDKKKDLHMKGVSRKYIDIIKDMYEGASTSVRTNVGRTEEFPITIGVHQGSALSPFLFAIVMDELTRGIQNDVPWCMMFADDIVLIDETKVGVQQKLELWRDTLEARGFRLSRSKTEYMECRFSDNSDREAERITFDGKVVHGSTFFRYLGSIIQKDGELDGDVAHRIKAGWLKWKSATGILCDPDMPHRLKGKFYRTAIRPALLYGTECWAVKQCHVQKMNVAEMRMLRWMCGHTKKDRLRNEVIREKVRVASIEDKMMENRLRWFGHVRRRPVDAPVRRLESWGTSNIVKGRGRPKKTWIKLIENDMRFLGIRESMVEPRLSFLEGARDVAVLDAMLESGEKKGVPVQVRKF
ncbi:hypothetical protein OROMI_016100 [Orobanche minor]